MSTKIIAELQDGKEVTVRTRTVKKIKLYPYDCLCGNERIHMELKPFPKLYKVLADLTRAGHWFWWSLVDRRNYLTNEVNFRAKDNPEAKKITKAYKELSDLGLVLRTRRQCYLINPQAVMPDFNELDKVRDNWDTLQEV